MIFIAEAISVRRLYSRAVLRVFEQTELHLSPMQVCSPGFPLPLNLCCHLFLAA